MPPKYMAKCWDKCVMHHCTTTITWNTKRYLCFLTPTNKKQAFVIHVRHATFYLFYARLPNTYLRSISERGTKYSPSTKIRLVQSRPYRMRKASDQAEFFRLLVGLFNYMFSGKSHVGYLNNNPSNPYVRRVVWFTWPFCFLGRWADW